MKNMTRALLMAAGLATSGSVFAVAAVDSTDITGTSTGECTLLAEDVFVGLSTKVHGAFDCNEITATIVFAGCHEGGSRQAKTTACTQIGTDAATGDPIWSDASCASTADTYEIADYRAFTATSSGGSIGEQQLGGRCSDATVQGVPAFTP